LRGTAHLGHARHAARVFVTEWRRFDGKTGEAGLRIIEQCLRTASVKGTHLDP
jgi:hypothetical protein